MAEQYLRLQLPWRGDERQGSVKIRMDVGEDASTPHILLSLFLVSLLRLSDGELNMAREISKQLRVFLNSCSRPFADSVT